MWTVGGSNPGWSEIFRTHPCWPWGPSSLLYNGYRVFLGGKAVGSWRSPPFPYSAQVKERVLPIWTSMSCYGVSFTLLFWGWFWEVAKLLTALYRVFCYPKNRGRFHRNMIYVPNCTVSWTRGYKSLMNWCLSDERLDRCHTQSASNKISSRVGLSHRWCQHIYRVMSVYIQEDVIYTG